MATRRKPPAAKRRPALPHETKDDVIRRLERRLKRLEKEHAAEREQYERRIAATKRAADRRLAVMMRELAELRHHEARAETLARRLAQRDTADGGDAATADAGTTSPGTAVAATPRDPAP
jgi:hypothetical protein